MCRLIKWDLWCFHLAIYGMMLISWCKMPQLIFRGLMKPMPQQARTVLAVNRGSNALLGNYVVLDA